jgi:hypothetical protein
MEPVGKLVTLGSGRMMEDVNGMTVLRREDYYINIELNRIYHNSMLLFGYIIAGLSILTEQYKFYMVPSSRYPKL